MESKISFPSHDFEHYKVKGEKVGMEKYEGNLSERTQHQKLWI